MKSKFGIVALMVAFLATPLLRAANGDLDKVIKQLDAAASRFQSAQADFQWDQYQRVVQSTDTQKGVIYFQRKGTDTLMAAHIRDLNGQPEPKDLVYKGGVLDFYQPKLKDWKCFSAGQNRSQYESFLTLGFGGSGSDLLKTWNVTYQGTETIGGVQTVKLDLVPKQESVKRNFTHILIWVDPARAVSLKQVFFDPQGDTRTALYSNIHTNTAIKSDVFTIKAASGVKRHCQ